MDTFLEVFGKKLKSLREKAAYTQEQMAELIGVDMRHVCRLESGASFTKHHVLLNYCRVLGVRPYELFEFEYDEELSMLATGTYGATYLKVVNTDGGVCVKSASKDIDIENLGVQVLTEEMLFRIAKELKREIVVDSVDKNLRQCVYKITPDGLKITVYAPIEVQHAQLLAEITEKLKDPAFDIRRLKYMNLAIEALGNKNARKDLKNLIEGMDIVS